MFKKILTTTLVIFGLIPAATFSAEYYVSPQGNDQATGTLADPFQTLQDAVKAVRTWRSTGGAGPATIFLREGRHPLDSTLVLGLADGDPSALPSALSEPGAGTGLPAPYLTFAAYPGENPLISGGKPITGWQKVTSAPAGLPAGSVDNVWIVDMPAGMERFYTMYDGEGRLPRARAKVGFNVGAGGTTTQFTFPAGSLKNWSNIGDVQVHIRPSRAWVINMLPLASVNTNTNTATTSVEGTYALSNYRNREQAWVENVLDELDEPGEWVVNTVTRKIYLWPRDPSPQGILLPSTSELIRVEGQINYDGPTDTPVRGIAFKGLTFSHADRRDWELYEQRKGWGLQHDWDMFDAPTALLRFRGAENCLVEQCRFIHSGGTGVRMDLHAQRNRIHDSEFEYLGEAGVLLAGYGLGTKDVNKHNEITNNLMHHFSEITWHSPGFWAWQSGHNLVKNNYFHHSGYSSILITNRTKPGGSLNGEGGRTIRSSEIASGTNNSANYEGWITREQYLHSRHNVVEYNEITHCVQLLSDGNGIYISGAGTGNIIRYNYIHDNLSRELPAVIRCDDDQHGTLIHGNILYNNGGRAACIAIKGINDVTNNFVVEQQTTPSKGYISLEWYPVTGSVIRSNILISNPDGGKAVGETARGGRRPTIASTEIDSNIYWSATIANWVSAHLQTMRAIDKEQNSRFGDPLFIDPAAGNFGFKPGSPALELGIEPLDATLMGRKEGIAKITTP